jgi:hypothetical protein
VIVVEFVVPSTRALEPLVTALTPAESVPIAYLVEDVSSIVTF